MDILLDDPVVDKQFMEILAKIRGLKNGATVVQMKRMGLQYRINWGASVISLRELAKNYEKNHLLALKLWNKQWRESMILATLLDEPEKVTEEQLDFWTKGFVTTEIAEQAVANLFVYSKFAYIKALEWCRGKKHLVRYTGLQLMGRLAMVDKQAIDEMFEPFFEVIQPLIKDPELGQVFYRSMTLLINRSDKLSDACRSFLEQAREAEEEQARKMAALLLEDIAEL
ncbi:DNA alkylation repair protein [uncultured Sunxiuqinia sp.]|uniref:DNA alkylation repair protein n=1 Tax=uncultured Sunxiuqinia sp. TaxID=1573825 RepID=UPI002605DE81|nr:DNA alkylation repair protein [uncultured Sunxiuqinia sp.]